MLFGFVTQSFKEIYTENHRDNQLNINSLWFSVSSQCISV